MPTRKIAGRGPPEPPAGPADFSTWQASAMRDLNRGTIDDHKILVANTKRAIARGEAEASAAPAKAAASKDSVQRIWEGGKPLSREDIDRILRKAGFTPNEYFDRRETTRRRLFRAAVRSVLRSRRDA